MKQTDIAIIGMACVFPQAASLRAYWSNIVNGVDAITEMPPDRWIGARNFSVPPEHEGHIPCARGGFVPSGLLFDPLQYGVMPHAVRHGDADQFLMIQLVDQALRDAGIDRDAPVRMRTDLVIGRGGYPTKKQSELMMRAEIIDTVLELLERKYPEWFRNGRRSDVEAYLRSTLSPNEVESLSTAIPNIVASRTANRLDLGGAAYTVDAACASSLLAVEEAVHRLRNGRSDLAVAGGVFMNHMPTFWHVFTRLGALSKSGWIRPFDQRADGLLIGDGGGAVVLKRLEDARRDGDAVYAIIRGVGSSSDGRHVDVLAPSSGGQVRALEAAYADADVDPDSVDYLELHGTGTVVGDLTEIATIREFFGSSPTPATARAMGSVKSMIGHTMPAAGMASLIKTALMLRDKILPPSLHCEQPRQELADLPFFINTQTRPWVRAPSRGPRRAGINAFGFGGMNVHVVLEEVPAVESRRRRKVVRPRPIRDALRRATEPVPFSADSLDDLAQQLRTLSSFLEEDESGWSLADIAFSAAQRLDAKRPVKLVILARDVEHLKQVIRTCLDRLDGPDADLSDLRDVRWAKSPRRRRGRVAVIFPGMGFPGLIGNYPDHLRELSLRFPEVREEFDFFEDRDRHPDDTVPTSSIFWPPPTLPEHERQRLKQRLAPPKSQEENHRDPIPLKPQERYLAAMGVTLSNWISWRVLRKFDVPADMIAGLSQGEMTALCAAGSADFHTAAPTFWKALNVDWGATRGERMAFAWTTEERLAPLLEKYPGTHVAIYMGPQAIVFGGQPEQLEAIAAELRAEDVLVQMLPYPPIHTPRLSYLRDELLSMMGDAEVVVRKPKTRLYSAILAEPYPDDPDGIRETFLLNLDRPLRGYQTVLKMYEDGARVFVQAGGGQFASGLRTVLPEDEYDYLAVALDVDEVDPLVQLHEMLATLFVGGVRVSFLPLWERRDVRQLDFENPQPAAQPSRTAIPLRIDWTPLTHENVPPRPAEQVDTNVDESTDTASAVLAQAAEAASQADLAPRPAEDRAQPAAVAAQSGSTTGADSLDETAASANPDSESVSQPTTATIAAPPAVTTDVEAVATGAETASSPDGSAGSTATEQSLPSTSPVAVGADGHHGESEPVVADSPAADATFHYAQRMPFAGRVVHFEPGREVHIERPLDLREDRFLHDHLFIHAPGVKPLEQCLPILPMTFAMELSCEVAAYLCPGLGLIGLENIRARKWIGIDGSTSEPLEARGRLVSVDAETGIQRVEVELYQRGQLRFSAVVLYAAEYRTDLQFTMADSSNDGPWPIAVEQVYGERRMFHGPRLQCITGLRTMGNPGFSAELTVLPRNDLFASYPDPLLLTDPCVMDGIGQIVGLWLRMHGWYVLPTGVEKVEIYRPSPPVGTVVPVRCELVRFDEQRKQTRCNIEVEDGQGGVWMRLAGWGDWIFRWTPRFADWLADPSIHYLCDEWALPEAPAGGVCTMISRQHVKLSDLDWASRGMLHCREMDAYHAIAEERLKRQFLLSRTAAKDAVRLWLSRNGGPDCVHPASLMIDHEPSGRPFVAELASAPKISIAHTQDAAVALAADVDVGIDVEPADHDTENLLPHFATEAERQLLAPLESASPENAWATRLWCAKEAVGKLLGTGLQGRPKQFEAIDIQPEGAILIRHRGSGHRFLVQTFRHDGMIVAYTHADAVTFVPALAR